jgi:hypothetical protein
MGDGPVEKPAYRWRDLWHAKIKKAWDEHCNPD